jgi:hypothetical protein
MMNDLRELGSPQEQRSAGGYIHLVDENYEWKTHQDEDFDYIDLPNKPVGQIGTATFYLSRDKNRPDDKAGSGLYLMSTGLEKISRQEAYDNGLYSLGIALENPNVRFRGSDFSVHISLDGQTDTATGGLENATEWHEKRSGKIEKTTSLDIPGWTTNNVENLFAWVLYVRPDRKFLEDLYFRISVSHPPQGGTNL